MKKTLEHEMIRTIIVDDEPVARKRVRDLLLKQADFEIVGECSTGAEAVKSITDISPDLVFLDIQMGDMDGFEVLSKLKIDLPITIFVTAYDKYALRAFQVHALDYLVKPFDDERFVEMIAFVRQQISRKKIGSLSEKLTSLLNDYHQKEKGERTFQTRLVLRSSGRISFIEVESIDWIGAEDSYVSINVGGKSHLMRESLTNLEKSLDPSMFLRIHRSTIVNITRIKELQPSFHGEFLVLLNDGKRLKLSRNYRESAMRIIAGAF